MNNIHACISLPYFSSLVVELETIQIHHHEEYLNSFITVRSEEQGCCPEETRAGIEETILHGSLLLEQRALLLEIR